MNFILRNNVGRYLSFRKYEMDDIEFVLREMGESEGLAKHFVEAFQKGIIPKEMSDRLAELIHSGMTSGKFWEVSNRDCYEIDGMIENACDIRLSVNWQVYLALFKEGPVSIHQTILNQHLGWEHERRIGREKEVECFMASLDNRRKTGVEEEYIPFE